MSRGRRGMPPIILECRCGKKFAIKKWAYQTRIKASLSGRVYCGVRCPKGPWERVRTKHPDSMEAKAKRAGLKLSTVKSRVYCQGLTLEEALSFPLTAR